jgi:hypothetical protein
MNAKALLTRASFRAEMRVGGAIRLWKRSGAGSADGAHFELSAMYHAAVLRISSTS